MGVSETNRKSGTTRLSVTLPKPLAQRAQRVAKRYGVSVGEVLREAVDAGMKPAILRLRRDAARQAQLDAELETDLAHYWLGADGRTRRRRAGEAADEVFVAVDRWEPEADA